MPGLYISHQGERGGERYTRMIYITPKHWGEGWRESYIRMILLQIIRERDGVRPIPGWHCSKLWERGKAWELYQDDITPNDEGEGRRESYTRIILLQMIEERGGVRAIPGWFYSKSSGRGMAWDLYQDIAPNYEGKGRRESYTRMILLQIIGRGVAWELCQDDNSLNHEGEGWRESYTRMILLQITREREGVRAIPGWYYSK